MMFNLVSILAVVAVATAQLSGRVGPSTPREAKAAKKICNILDYGGAPSATADNSAAFTKAWDACKAGGQVLIPSGRYGLDKWIDLSGGKGVSINLEGIIFRLSNGTAGGTIISVKQSDDFEFYSRNSKGAIQGYGFEFHKGIMTFTNVSNFSIHNVALVDAPLFHFTMDGCTNGEAYNMIIYGGNRDGLEGIDVRSTNVWIHDVEISNGADCVTVKSPSTDLLIESIFCNLSGGCAIGPLGENTKISDITYQNIYSHNCDHMLLIKSNGGSGPMNSAIFNNFTGHSNKYALNLDAFWPGKEAEPGQGVEYDSLTFSNWAGTCKDGTAVPPIQLHCPPELLCGNLQVDEFNIWTETGSSEVYKCQNAYGLGACMNPFAGNGAYSTAKTVTAIETAKYAIATMPVEATKGMGITVSIDIPAVPTTFYPGLKPTSSLMAK